MASEVLQPEGEPDGVLPEPERQSPEVAVLGRRLSFMNVLAAALFAAVVGTVLFTAEDPGFFLFVLTPLVLGNLWASIVMFIRRPRLAINEGNFSLRILPTWSTKAANVADVKIQIGKTVITFHDLDAVEPEVQRSAMLKSFQNRGHHLETGRGMFSLEEVNELRAAFGMAPQREDQFAEFETQLNELTPRLIVTPLLIAANVIVFLAMAVQSGGVLDANIFQMIAWGANHTTLTTSGEWWRLLTSMFLHFGAIHLLFNMWILREIGRVVERLVGNVGFAIGYIVSGFFGSVASVFWHESIVSAGASGAVFGVFGMLLGFVTLHKRSIPIEVIKDHRGSAVSFIVYNVIVGLSISWIDQAAHIGGFLAGFVCGLVLGCDLSEASVKRTVRNLTLAFSGLALAVVAIRMLPVRPPDLLTISQEIGQVSIEKANQYERWIAQLDSGQQTPEQIAEKIRTGIVPVYRDLSADLEKTRPQNEQQEHLKSTFVKYVRLHREGWELLAISLETGDILPEGLAVEKFEAALELVAENIPTAREYMKQPPVDFRTELAVLMVSEDRARKKYDELMQQFQRGELNDKELADSIENEVLSHWNKGQQRFLAAAKCFAPEQQSVTSRIENYLDLQKSAWLLQVEALREGDEAKAALSQEKFEAAASAAQTLWEQPAEN